MFEILKISLRQGRQYINDVKNAAVNKMFRGFPEVRKTEVNNEDVKNLCPADAIESSPLSVDLGKCILCGKCERTLGESVIKFTNEHRISSDSREKLIITSKTNYKEWAAESIRQRSEIHQLFNRSFKLRSVSAGGCNGCEMELNACSNVNFDMGRFGIDIVAGPRHADGIIITGPITENMAEALEETYNAVPEPKVIILAGACAISKGLFSESDSLKREFIEKHKIDLYIPGCPVHPLTVINGILGFLKR
ncbi:MAG: NADH:ubiquinone oxidoreductase [bacterium]|nr:NADH:ubiquinone oxidoreductase [bacterium]